MRKRDFKREAPRDFVGPYLFRLRGEFCQNELNLLKNVPSKTAALKTDPGNFTLRMDKDRFIML